MRRKSRLPLRRGFCGRLRGWVRLLGFAFTTSPGLKSFTSQSSGSIGLFTNDFILVINVFYLLGYVLSSLTSLFAFRLMRLPDLSSHWNEPVIRLSPNSLGTGRVSSIRRGILSGSVRLSLSCFGSLTATLSSNGPRGLGLASVSPGKEYSASCGCILLGSGGVYYAFFTAFLFLSARCIVDDWESGS
jgi:hypothetical protein